MAILPSRGHDDEYVFGLAPDTPLVAFSRIKKQIDAKCGVTGWTFHDLRRTARTLLSKAGVHPDHAERCLGHVIGGVRGVYDRHEFHAEKVHAFEALAQQIDLIVNPPKGNVRQLKRRA
jgi:integrase